MIVIDDEEATRKGLISNIDWGRLGVEIVGEAEDGIVGLNLVKRIRPEIVLLDVRMPRMDGLACARELRRDFPECKLIFMSGYSDKEYLKYAIQIKAVDFVEKPIVKEEIIQAVRDAVISYKDDQARLQQEITIQKNVRQSMPLLNQEIARELTTGSFDFKKISQDFIGYNIDIPPKADYLVIVIKLPGDRRQGEEIVPKALVLESIAHRVDLENYKCVCGSLDAERIVVHLFGGMIAKKKSMEMLAQKLLDDTRVFYKNTGGIVLGIGPVVHGIACIPDSFHKAEQALRQHFFFEKKEIFFYHQDVSSGFALRDDFLPNLESAFWDGKLIEIINSIERLLRDIKMQDNHDIDYIKSVFFLILKTLYDTIERRDIFIGEEKEDTALLWSTLLSFSTLNEVAGFVIEKIKHLFASVEDLRGTSKKVGFAINYVREHYEAALTVSEIAEKVELSTPYLCYCFKKETKKTVNQYIEEVRIEKSRELIAKTSMKLNEIARKVGYKNAGYFSKIFKEATGMYPSEFRRSF